MCTHPIQLKKTFPTGKTITRIVPCGRCSECRSALQSEVAALSVLEANSASSVHFYTLTYNNESLPVNRIEPDGSVHSIMVGANCYHWQIDDWNRHGCMVLPDDDGGKVCPTLRREDLKLHMKVFRRRFSTLKDQRFAFLAFGEYGSQFNRPHYHLLTYNLSDEQAKVFSDLWSKRFGFVLCEKIPPINKDGSSAYAAVSMYVSKYISKGDALPLFVQQGYAEKPRRQSSIRFGRGNLPLDKLRNFI